MLCQVCQKQPAALKITKLESGVPTEYNVCEAGAAQLSPHFAKLKKKATPADKEKVEHLLMELFGQGELGAVKEDEEADDAGESIRCPECGLDFRQYRKSYMLGCPHCYDAFGEKLLADIKRIQDATSHVGDSPEASRVDRGIDVHAQVRQLQRELTEAVKSEDFDRAARLRDQIRALEEQLAAGSAD